MDSMEKMLNDISGFADEPEKCTITLTLDDVAHRLACEWRWQKNMRAEFLAADMKAKADECAAIMTGIEMAARAVNIDIYHAFCAESGAEDTSGIMW